MSTAPHRRSIVPGVLALSLALMGHCAVARATDGTQLIGIGAVQKGTAGAGVASAKDSTWVLLNPAGLLSLDRRLDVSVEVFAPYRTMDPAGLFGNLTGESYDDSIFYIPAIGYSNGPGADGEDAWGLGLYGVSGMGVEYRTARAILPRLFLKNYDRRTEYSVATMVFGYARDLGGGWVVGVAPHLNFSMFKSDMLTLKFRQADAENGWDTSYGAGFSLGFNKRWDRFAVGATYTSRQWLTEFEKYDDLFFESMDLPQNLQAGVAFDITPNLEWALDYKWIDWTGVRQIGAEPLQGGFGWKDQHIVKTGLTWEAAPRWTFRAGAAFANSPIDEEHVFANALFPAVVKTHATLGVSHALTENSELHFAYHHAFNNHLTDNGKGDLFSVLGKGSEISLRENTFTVQYTYRF